jgi:RimJ/RimL family protein N-acetyltransferase
MESVVFEEPQSPIRLRTIREDDAEAIMDWVNDPEITRNFAAFSKKITVEEERAFLRSMLASDTDRLFAIEPAGGGPLIGTAGIHRIYWPARNGRIGLMIGKQDLQGRGLGQATMRALVAFGFAKLALHKIWLVHYADNHRMKHIAGKLGFEVEGLLRDEYFHAGVYHDMVRHAQLEPDWRQRQLEAARS